MIPAGCKEGAETRVRPGNLFTEEIKKKCEYTLIHTQRMIGRERKREREGERDI